MKGRVLLFLWIFCGGLLAQPDAPVVTASLEPAIVIEGQHTFLYLDVQGDPGALPKTLDVPGMEVELTAPIGVPRQEKNGRVRMVNRYRYAIAAPRPGTYTIPAFEIVVSGIKSRVPEQKLIVKSIRDLGFEGVGLPESFVHAAIGKTSIYIGEMVPVEITVFLPRETSVIDWAYPEFSREGFIAKRHKRKQRVDMVIGEQLYQSAMYTTEISPIAEGPLTLGPVILQPRVRVRGQGGIAESLYRSTKPKTIKVMGNTLKIEGLPLPDGAPDTFNGSVGTFALELAATPMQVSLGSPVTLDLGVLGKGNMDSVSMPEMVNDAGWKRYQVKDSMGPGGMRKSFQQIISPERFQEAISPFVFGYFDPNERRYMEVSTPPVPLEWSGPMEFNEATSKAGAEGVADFGSGADSPNATLTDVLATAGESPVWYKSRGPWYRDLRFLAWQLIPFALLVYLLSIVARRRYRMWKLAEATRRAQSWRHVLEEMKGSSVSQREFYQLAARCLALWEKSDGAELDQEPKEIVALKDRHAWIHYGARGNSEVPVSEGDKQEVIHALESLKT